MATKTVLIWGTIGGLDGLNGQHSMDEDGSGLLLTWKPPETLSLALV